MTTPADPAEQLLLLGAGFARHNDALSRLRLDSSSPATALTDQAISPQHLARSALDIVDGLNAQRVYLSPQIRTVYARVRQLAHLATDAGDHLLDAEDILDDTRVGVPAKGDGPLLTYRQALEMATSRLTVVQDLTALGAPDALAAAELFVTGRRRRGESPITFFVAPQRGDRPSESAWLPPLVECMARGVVSPAPEALIDR
ncbi:hypothetical protein ACH4FX_38025 [Streptomyces sp. NPDC018019]|uniref:hypothetical protein n=1 Tax=Streptomyces sp. NPDC018019 TaxID=3365030 RepID=UPI003798BAB2